VQRIQLISSDYVLHLCHS